MLEPETIQEINKQLDSDAQVQFVESSDLNRSDASCPPPVALPDLNNDTMEEHSICPEEEVFRALDARIAALEQLFKAKILRTEHEEKIINQMHGELQRYKEDMYSQLVRPILLDIIAMRESILRVEMVYIAKPEGEQSIPVKTFSSYATEIQDILEKNHIEIYRSERLTDFIPIRQRATEKMVTNDQSLHGKVAQSLSDGYNYNGRTISAEKVALYLYTNDQAQMKDKEDDKNG